MNLKIGRKVYDTEKSRLIAQKANGCYGDPTGYEEVLYQKAENDYFFFGQGGSNSPYPQSTIAPVASEQAKAWLIDVIGASAAAAEFPEFKAAKPAKLTVDVKAATAAKAADVKAKASAKKPVAEKAVKATAATKPASKKATKKV